MKHPDPPRSAVKKGHELVADPPVMMDPTHRWTCKTCGLTVSDYRGAVSGPAAERECKP